LRSGDGRSEFSCGQPADGTKSGSKILQIAPVDVPVFHLRRKRVWGKKSFPAWIHLRSKRRESAVRESELRSAARRTSRIGVILDLSKGAFTGAVRSKPGKFEFGQQKHHSF